jgi:hypothetical protein
MGAKLSDKERESTDGAHLPGSAGYLFLWKIEPVPKYKQTISILIQSNSIGNIL